MRYDELSEKIIKKTVIKQNEKGAIEYLRPSVIQNIRIDEGMDRFWNHHGYSEESYTRLTYNFVTASKMMKEKGTLDHLPSDHELRIAYGAFTGSEPIDVIAYGDNFFLNNGGRHRTLMAQRLEQQGVDITVPVLVIRYVDATNNNNSNQINNNFNSTNMQRGIDGQIVLLQDMVKFLGSMQEQLNDMVKTHQNFLNSLDNEGIDVNILQQLEEYFADNKRNVESLVQNIEDEDIPYAQRIIQHLESTPR